jgi:alpha-tubulin suppressor-like RCC1 family protein
VPRAGNPVALLLALAAAGCGPGRLAAVPHVDASRDPLQIVALAAGAEHTCALRAGGTVVCWGANEVGQVGSGDDAIAWAPREVPGLVDVEQIAGAAGVTCARRKGGAVRCWGAVRKALPLSARVDVEGVAGARQIAVGPDKLTALLGDGSVVQKSLRDASPVRKVEGITGAVEVSAGYRHACALLPTHHVLCWGKNDIGELGDGTTRGSEAPVEVVGLANAERIGTSQRGNCAWKANGDVACWGNLGAGRPFSEPFTLPLVSNLLAAAGGLGKACAIYANGTAECVKRGSVGPDRSRVARVKSAVQVIAGYLHFCALERDGRVLCWGSNEHGQLGDPAAASPTPRRVPGVDQATDLIATKSQACALRAGGAVVCWGARSQGSEDGSAPRAVPDLQATRLAAHGGDICAIDRAGVPRCWGRGLGWAGIAPGKPSELRPIAGAREIALGGDFACALGDGGLRCLGKNHHGEVGDGTKLPRTAPVAPVGLEAPAQVVASEGLVCARLGDGRVSCWGITATKGEAPSPFLHPSDHVYGIEPLLPNPAAWVDRAIPTLTPTIVAGLADVARLDRVGVDLCAVRRDGSAACWSRDDALRPRPVGGLSHARALAGSREHRCALLDDGRVACWGRNDFGELGTGAFGKASAEPVVVAGAQRAAQIAAGDGFTCARTHDGAVLCWGSNRFGELGGNPGYEDPVEVPRAGLRVQSMDLPSVSTDR